MGAGPVWSVIGSSLGLNLILFIRNCYLILLYYIVSDHIYYVTEFYIYSRTKCYS